jgi:hypothetical protein
MRRTRFCEPVRQQIAKPDIAVRQFCLGFAQPLGKGRIHVSETAVAVDRIEPDRRVFDKLDKLFLFGPDDPLKLVALGHILQPPDNRIRLRGQGHRRNFNEIHVGQSEPEVGARRFPIGNACQQVIEPRFSVCAVAGRKGSKRRNRCVALTEQLLPA